MTVRETAKYYAKIARQENKQSEKFSLKYPHYTEWAQTAFNEARTELLSIVGHC